MNSFYPITSTIETGLTVIEASAGTGKTFSISHLVPRLLLENPAWRVSEILLVTYTKDAAGELADRTRKVFAGLVSDAPAENSTMAQLRALWQKHLAVWRKFSTRSENSTSSAFRPSTRSVRLSFKPRERFVVCR